MERRPFKTNYAGAIYGTILSMAVISTASKDQSIGPIMIACWAAATAVVFWIAHAYSIFLVSGHARGGSTRAEILSALRHDWPMVQGSLIPAAAMLLAPLGLVSTDAATFLAVGIGVLVLFAAGLYLGRRQHMTWLRALTVASINAVIGLLIVGLKVFVH